MRRVEEGDPRAVEAVAEAGDALAVAMIAAVNLLDPDAVVLGGLYALLAGRLAADMQVALGRVGGGLRGACRRCGGRRWGWTARFAGRRGWWSGGAGRPDGGGVTAIPGNPLAPAAPVAGMTAPPQRRPGVRRSPNDPHLPTPGRGPAKDGALPSVNTNPIIPGFHPDPSICRVGDTYYLATSSFEYFPGVPVFRSTDLIRWEQIGNALDRPGRLKLLRGLEAGSVGVYAPTLRHHDGLFWLVTTNVLDRADGHMIVHAADPAGDWSDPVYTKGAGGPGGIDPDLTWDEDGVCHLTWTQSHHITQAAVDPMTGEVLSEPKVLWAGTPGMSYVEAPHLYKRNDWWYLVVAEGGTERGHAVSVARSRAISGPFTPYAANPVFSHRSSDHPVQSTGHADLVERPDGTWAMVYLAVRPYGSHPKWHVNGRETFLAGVEWVDDWPVVVEDAFDVPPAATSFTDEFAAADLHPRWISPGTDPGSFAAVHEGVGLVLAAGRTADARETVHLLAARTRDLEWQAEATVATGDAALVVQIDDAHWAAVERRGGTLTARAVAGPFEQVFGTAEGIPTDRPLAIRTVDTSRRLSLHNGPDRIELGYVEAGSFRLVAGIDGRYVSTEVAGGFTGRVVGVEALGADAVLTRFAYTGHPTA
ncbi:family 43 glycosylhydrolase [Yinghuangia aomiensis]